MGMYTELQFSAEIDYDKHTEIIDVLRYMTGDTQVSLDDLTFPKHDLFKTERWEYMLRGSSYYFSGQPQCVLNEEHDFRLVSLTVLCSVKNYDQEIDKFLNWIRPYVSNEQHRLERLFVGYMRYETHIDPSLIYFTKSKVKFVKPAVEELEDELDAEEAEAACEEGVFISHRELMNDLTNE